jgi:hypothetical protein
MKFKKRNKKGVTESNFKLGPTEQATYAILQWRDDAKHTEVGEFFYQIESPTDRPDTYRMVYNSEMEYHFEGLTTENVEVTMDATSLNPLSFNCCFKSMGHDIELNGVYKSNKVIVHYTEDGTRGKWTEKLPFQVLDNYQSLVALRSLDFKAMKQIFFSLVNALTLSIVEVDCSCLGQEIVKTEIDTYECYRICLQVYDPMPFTQYLLFSVQPPHHLIKVIKGPLVFQVRHIS